MNRRCPTIIITAFLTASLMSAPAFAGLEDIVYEKGAMTDVELNTIKAKQERAAVEQPPEPTHEGAFSQIKWKPG